MGFYEKIKILVRKNFNHVTRRRNVENSKRVLEKPEYITARLRARFQNIPPEVSLADELIAERREAAKKEAKE